MFGSTLSGRSNPFEQKLPQECLLKLKPSRNTTLFRRGWRSWPKVFRSTLSFANHHELDSSCCLTCSCPRKRDRFPAQIGVDGPCWFYILNKGDSLRMIIVLVGSISWWSWLLEWKKGDWHRWRAPPCGPVRQKKHKVAGPFTTKPSWILGCLIFKHTHQAHTAAHSGDVDGLHRSFGQGHPAVLAQKLGWKMSREKASH